MSSPKKIFGTDGVRGTANIEPVTAETALKLGRAAGHVFKNLQSQPRGDGRHKIVLGKDTRLSGYMLENAISSGILSMGVDVLFIGPLPTPGVWRELGADVIVYGNQPDGKNINKDCGSMHPALMCRKIWEHRADLGIAHDGDADRVLLCDETGKLIDGDDIMAIAGLELLAQGLLAQKTLVSTVMSNAGLEPALAAAGGKVVRTAVGDKNVIDEMLRHGFNFGGDQS